MFTTHLDTRWLHPEKLRLKILAPLVWNRIGYSVTVPAGFATDLASVPRILWRVIPPWTANRCAVLHDFLYYTGSLTRAECDIEFYRAMEAEEISGWRALAMWLGVRIGGWVAWRNHRRRDGSS